MYYLQSRYYNPAIGRFINADAFTSTGQGLLGNNMFAYCRNNPVRRIDIKGSFDQDCIDGSNDDSEPFNDVGRQSGASDPVISTGENPESNGASQFQGYGQAPKQGVPGSTYTQLSSDGENSIVSQTTYGEYGAPSQRIDYQGRDHNIGLPHVHEFSWGIMNGRVVPQGERIYAYRM